MADRILTAQAQREFWYQSFHQLDLAEHLVDGRPEAVRRYLRHFWAHWSGPGFEPTDDHLDHLVSAYAEPGAFTASIGWYRAGAGAVARSLAEQAPQPADRLAVPTTVLWPEHDPLFPRAWSDRLDDFFADVRVQHVDGVRHFTPLESPRDFAGAVAAAAATAGIARSTDQLPAARRGLPHSQSARGLRERPMRFRLPCRPRHIDRCRPGLG